MRNQFSTFDIIKALGIPRERLRNWQKADFIKPTYASLGQGQRATFTRWDVYGIELFRMLLLDVGIIRKTAADYVKEFIRLEKDDQNDPVEYVILQMSSGPGKKLLRAISTTKGKWAMEIKTGHIGMINPKVATVFFDPRQLKGEFKIDWDYIHIIDFSKIKNRVDRALSAL